MEFVFESACGSDVGRVRLKNEDNYFFDNKIRAIDNENYISPHFKVHENYPIFFGVFDGLGGAADGHIASYTAAAVFGTDVSEFASFNCTEQSFLSEVVTHMNYNVCSEASRLNNNMGTTFVGACFCRSKATVCNVGDSRAYLIREGQINQISKDHIKEIPPFMQGKQKVKPHLSQCIGIPDNEFRIAPYITQNEIKRNDIYLLCSDGITDMLKDDEILAIVADSDNVTECVDSLIGSALMRGGRDNATVIVIKVKEKV